MHQKSWKDCTVQFEADNIVIQNSKTKRCYQLNEGVFVTTQITNNETGYCWGTTKSDGNSMSEILSVTSQICDNSGLSKEHLRLEVEYSFNNCIYTCGFSVFPELPFITMDKAVRGEKQTGHATKVAGIDYNGVENNYTESEKKNSLLGNEDICDVIMLPKAHIKVEAVRFFDKTDINDTLVKSEKQMLYPRAEYSAVGNMFLVESYENGEVMLIAKEAPTHTSAIKHLGKDIQISNGVLKIVGCGLDDSIDNNENTMLYSTSVGVGKTEEILKLYKEHYSAVFAATNEQHTYILSNTWGDRNQDLAICHDFMMREIDIAKEIGVDVVQIDDGWEHGITANSKRAKGGVWGGYYSFDNDFWKVSKDSFPSDLYPVVKSAKNNGMNLGLWFGPDSSNHFANWEKDVETLLNIYHTYGVCHFKLDGVDYNTKLGEQNFLRFLEETSRRSNNEIHFNLDVTAQNRTGYIFNKQYGNLFVENRYTDWTNYYPHNTLKNLWQLSRYIPSRKLQFELLNNKRNADKYGADSMAPINYTMDYEFACVMLSNPLIWMEMTALCEQDINALKSIIAVYKEHRDALWGSQVSPIGAIPDGMSFTGFQIECDDKSGYLLLFRENTAKSETTIKLTTPLSNLVKIDYLYSNRPFDEMGISVDTASIKLNFKSPRSFVFARYTLG